MSGLPWMCPDCGHAEKDHVFIAGGPGEPDRWVCERDDCDCSEVDEPEWEGP